MRSVSTILATVMLCTSRAVAADYSNPDTPFDLKTAVVLGAFKTEGSQKPTYFRFKAGPGTVKIRFTLRPNSDGMTAHASVTDETGTELLNLGDGTSNDKDSVQTGTVTLADAKTLVVHVTGNALFYGKRHPTWRLQLEGDVSLDKAAKPLQI